MNTEYRVEKKRVKWFLIGAISLVAFIFSFIICFFSKILFGGIAVISGTLLMLSAFFVIKMKAKGSYGALLYYERKDVVKAVAVKSALIIICILILALAFDFLMFIMIGTFSVPVKDTQYEGVEYYENGELESLRYGKKALEYLPKLSEIDGAEKVDFYYIDGHSYENFFIRTETQVFLRVKYTPEKYEIEKKKLENEGKEYSDYSKTWHLAKENLFLNYLYYTATLVDDQNTVIYFVNVADVDRDVYLPENITSSPAWAGK